MDIMQEHLKQLYRKYGYYQYWNEVSPSKNFKRLLHETQGAINEVFAIMVESGFSEVANSLNRDKLIAKGRKCAEHDNNCQFCDMAG